MVTGISAIQMGDRSCFPAHFTLKEALNVLGGDPPSAIPFWVWVLENPYSPIALPGNIDLYRHDCLHVLLERGFSAYDEAFIVGFSMGNDVQIQGWHIALFKWLSGWVYSEPYQFDADHLTAFDLGFAYGRSLETKNLNRFDFQAHEDCFLHELRHQLGIQTRSLGVLQEAESLLTIVPC